MSDADRRAVWPASWYDPCEPLRNVPHVRVTSAKAAVYTKIMFLLDLGLIDEELYKRCASNGGEIKLRLNYTRTDNGFHRVKDFASGQYLYSHKNIKPGFPMDQSEPQTFRINAKGELNTDDGKKYDTQMYLTIWEAKKPSLPRGLYTIKVPSFEIDMPCPQNSPWTFDLVVKEASSNSFCATDGLILFTRSSRQFIEGKMLINTTLGHVLGAPKHDTPNFQVYIRWKRRP